MGCTTSTPEISDINQDNRTLEEKYPQIHLSNYEPYAYLDFFTHYTITDWNETICINNLEEVKGAYQIALERTKYCCEECGGRCKTHKIKHNLMFLLCRVKNNLPPTDRPTKSDYNEVGLLTTHL